MSIDKRLLEQSAQLRDKIERLAKHKVREISYKPVPPSVKVSDLPKEEQAKVIYWYAHPKRNV